MKRRRFFIVSIVLSFFIFSWIRRFTAENSNSAIVGHAYSNTNNKTSIKMSTNSEMTEKSSSVNTGEHFKSSYGIHELSQNEPFLSRILQVQKHCKETENRNFTLRSTTFKYDDRLQLLMCETPKVASTTWQLLFLRLSGFEDEFTKALLHKWDYSIIPNKHFQLLATEAEAKERARSYTSFLLTRHPFERLVSAYSSKLTNRTDVYAYRKKVGKLIAIQQADKHMHGIHYRRQTRNTMTITKDQKFGSLSQTQQKEVLEYLRVILTGEVSFPQFVEFIIGFYNRGQVENMDIHWRPQVDLCRPCAFNYSYIIRFENIVSESNNLLDYIQKYKLEKPLREKLTFPGKTRPLTEDYQTKEMFKQIAENDVEILRKLYADDFLFYDYDPYLYRGYSK